MTPKPSGKILEGMTYKTSDSAMQLETSLEKPKIENKEHKMEVVWSRIIVLIYLHLAGFYGMYLMCTKSHILSPIISKSLPYYNILKVFCANKYRSVK